MKRAPWLYTLMQIALWSIHGVLISYAQRYLAGMGMRDSSAARRRRASCCSRFWPPYATARA